MPLPLGGYGACQVVSVSAESVLVCPLDWWSPDLPTPAQLTGIGPLCPDHHAHSGTPAVVHVSRQYDTVPADLVWLGELPPHPGIPTTSNSYTGWEYPRMQVVWQRRWDRLPEAARAAYRAAAYHGDVRLDLGGQPTTALAGLSRFHPREPLVPPTGDVRWAGLDVLPRCTALTWSGAARGLVDHLVTRPMISELTWREVPAEVDLGGTGLTDLRLEEAAGSTVRLPPGLLRCHLTGGLPAALTSTGQGRWLDLVIELTDTSRGSSEPAPPLVPPTGLAGVRRLSLVGDGVIPAAALARFPDLETLRIQWRRPPGRLVDPETLSALSRLHTVELFDGYGCTATTLPDLPALRRLTFHGLPRSVATALRARYRGVGVELVVHGAKSDTWLAANLGNPFRDWVDDDARGGAAAAKAYSVALRAIDRLRAAGGLPADDPAVVDEVAPILRTLVEALNRVEAKYEIIDTVNRERAGEVFADLARRAGVPADRADDWFDDWRDF